jgi:hypothetical protein
MLNAHRPSLASLVFGLVALLVGCGTSAVGTSGRGAPVDESRAIVYANAINLRASDVPGLVGSATAHQRPTQYGPFGRLGDRCAGGAVRHGDVLGVLSDRFVGGHERHPSFFPIRSVVSAVYVFRDDAMASQEASVKGTARALSCLRRDGFEPPATVTGKGEPLLSGVEIRPVSLSAGRATAHGYRLSGVLAPFLKAPRAGGRPNYYEDLLGVAVGRAVITLKLTGSPRPFPATTERRLVSLLHGRAVAASEAL